MNITAFFSNAIPGNSAIDAQAPATVGQWLHRLSRWPLALLAAAMIVVCEPLQAQTNTAATGAPAVTAADSVDLTMVGPNEDSVLTATQGTIMDADGITTFNATWAWHEGDTADGDFAAISGAAAATFTPLQAHVGKFIRACATFDDDDSNEETRCWTSVAAVVNTNDVNALPSSVDLAIGRTSRFRVSDFLHEDEEGADYPQPGTFILPSLPVNGILRINGIPATAPANAFAREFNAGQITYTPSDTATVGVAYDSFDFEVFVTGYGAGPAATMTINLVANSAPDFGDAAVANQIWLTGTALSLELPEATGGNGTVTYSISPALPAGLSLDAATAAISGTPTAASAIAEYTLTATDVDGETSTLTFRAAVQADAAPAFAANAAIADQSLLAGSTVNLSLPGATGGNTVTDIPLVYTITPALPAGLSFDSATRTLSGTPTATAEQATYTYTAADADSNTATSDAVTLTFSLEVSGQNINIDEVVAVFNATAVAGATDAIMGAMSASPAATTFGLSLDGTSLMDTARTMGQSATTDTDGRTAWFHGTTAANEYNAAYNASDNSAESLRHRLQSMADGDLAMNYQQGGSAMRFWARYQSIDISGNEDAALEYDGSGTGFYVGADRRITDKMRLGLAISSDSADMTLRLDADGMDDEASRSATTVYPYMQMDLGNNNHLRVIAGIGSGDLDIKSTVNDSTASAGLSWNMLAASISHHRPMKGNLSARFDGSLQLGNSSTDATTFTNGSTLAAADASTNEIAVNAELRYKNNNFTPFASLSGRKLGGDLSQSLAMDLGLGADLQTGAAILRLAITRQLNDTTHKRDSLSLDIATTPNQSGLSASLGSRYDSLSGRPQWQSTVRWQRRIHELSLAASQSDCRLQARLRW